MIKCVGECREVCFVRVAPFVCDFLLAHNFDMNEIVNA